MNLSDCLFIEYGMNLPGSMKEGELPELAKEHGNECDDCAAYCCKWNWKLSATAKVLWLPWLRQMGFSPAFCCYLQFLKI